MPNTLLPPFDVSVTSGQTAVREALARLLEQLVPLELGIEEAGTVELVLAEALNNIVEHAYPEESNEGPIKIKCIHKSDGLHFRIIDEGAAMPNEQLPVGIPPSLEVEKNDLPEGGFGWFLIKDLARDVSYVREETWNCLELRLAVGLAS